MRIRGNSLPWITPNIKNLMKARDFHKKKAVEFNSQLHWAKYKDTRNKVNSESYKAKKRYFCDKFEDCAQTTYIHTYIHTLYFNSNLQSSSNNELISSSM